MKAQLTESILRANTVHENIPGVNCGLCAVVLEPSSNKHRQMTHLRYPNLPQWSKPKKGEGVEMNVLRGLT